MPALFGLPELRLKWDEMCVDAGYVQQFDGDMDAILRVVMKPPLISAREAFLRRVIARNFPEPGCITIAGADGSAGMPLAAGCVRGYICSNYELERNFF